MSTSGKHLRWLMISLAFFATLINYLDRQTLSVVAPVLLDQFHMDSIGYSRVVSALPADVHHNEWLLRSID